MLTWAPTLGAAVVRQMPTNAARARNLNLFIGNPPLFSHIRTMHLQCGRAEQQSLSTRAHPGGVFPSPRRHTVGSKETHNGESVNSGFARKSCADETGL